jgi:hypothetical protein
MKCPSCGSENIAPITDTTGVCLNLYCETYFFKIKPAPDKSRKGPETKETTPNE